MKEIYKVLWHSGAAIFWLGILVLLSSALISVLMPTVCSWDKVEESYSQNGEYRAYVLMTGCGALSSPQTQIYVERVTGKGFPIFNTYKTDSLIRLNGRPDQIDYKVTWKSDKELLISGFEFERMMAFKNQDWGPYLPRVYFEPNGS